MDDASFIKVFKPVIGRIMERYAPGAVVLQCGADSLAGDRLGCFNLSLKGHSECVRYVRSFNIPTIVMGGGGYTLRNVARCWTLETAVVVGMEVDNALPYNEYLGYYGPDYTLSITPSNMENCNTTKYLEDTTEHLFGVLDSLEFRPSVQIETGSMAKTPAIHHINDLKSDEVTDPDVKPTDSWGNQF